jgi:hypothetical protein
MSQGLYEFACLSVCAASMSYMSKRYAHRRIILDSIVSVNYGRLDDRSKKYWRKHSFRHKVDDYDAILANYMIFGGFAGAFFGLWFARKYPLSIIL